MSELEQAKSSYRFGHLHIFGFLTENGKMNFQRKVFKAKCECGNDTEITNWELALKTKNSCGCRKTTELEDKIITYLEDNDIPYLLDFQTRERNGNPICFNILVPYDNGMIIMYEQDETWNRHDSLKSATKTFSKIALRDERVKYLGDSFGMQTLFLKYYDVDNVEDLMDEFFKNRSGE